MLGKCSTLFTKLEILSDACDLTEVIGNEARRASAPIQRIVIHRDGRAWPSEVSGARRAIEFLKKTSVLPASVDLTVLEIHKKPSIPLRILDTASDVGASPRKPRIGALYVQNRSEAFLCTTGWPFRQPGTPNPIHLLKVCGGMTIEQCAQDLFSLSTLAWTRPEGCSRYPVTLRLADRFLADEAADAEDEDLAFAEEQQLGEAP